MAAQGPMIYQELGERCGCVQVLSKAAAGTEAGKQGAPRSVKVDVKAAKAAIAKVRERRLFSAGRE